MIPTVGGGSNFHGAVMYLYEGRRDAPKDKAVTILFAAGVRTSSPEAMIADFNLGRAANPELKQAVWSGTLNFNPDDLAAGTLTDAKMLEITLAHCQKMGLDKTQLVVALHKDTDKPHTHIVANRVADDGHTISDSNNRQRAQAAAQELVAAFGLTPPMVTVRSCRIQIEWSGNQRGLARTCVRVWLTGCRSQRAARNCVLRWNRGKLG
jgi:methionine-rich copper-binding protein CopC